MAKYKVGDKVRVITNGERYKTYWMEGKSGRNSMVETMLDYGGKVVTITKASNTGYSVSECPGCGWVDEMFDGLAEETPREFKVGDRVKCIDANWGELEVGDLGTVIVYNGENDIGVEFDKPNGGHNCGRGKDGHCLWVGHTEIELVKEEPKAEPIPTPVVNVNVTVNLYENACWYCRKGGLVDLYLAGAMGICPSCGRVCNNTLPTKANSEIALDFTPSRPSKRKRPKKNTPLTKKELIALPDGTKVFLVFKRFENGKWTTDDWDARMTCWHVKEGDRLVWEGGFSFIYEYCDSDDAFTVYLERPERPEPELPF